MIALMLGAVLPIAAQQSKTKSMSGAMPETLMIVSSGENAPESIVRVVSMKKSPDGKYNVVVAGGACQSQSKTRLKYIIDTKETLAKGDLFFIVPVAETPSQSALRRLTSNEAAQYAKCQWRDN